jgi:hypothetical protein
MAMGIRFELWDTRSGNLLEDFESEAEAVAAVREYLELNGPQMVRDLTLGAVPDTGLVGATGLPPVLDGDELLARVAAHAGAPPSVPAAGAKHERTEDVRGSSGLPNAAGPAGRSGTARGRPVDPVSRRPPK